MLICGVLMGVHSFLRSVIGHRGEKGGGREREKGERERRERERREREARCDLAYSPYLLLSFS